MTHHNISNLTITYVPISDLRPYKLNAKTHPKAQLTELAESIMVFGFNTPIAVNDSYQVIAGHGRLEAAKLAGLINVPVIKLDHLTPAEVRGYRLADNKLAEKSKWNMEVLALEIQELIVSDTDFEITTTGFAIPEIDYLLQDHGNKDPDENEKIPRPPTKAVTRPGDCWLLGDHKLYCGNSLELASYQALMGSERAEVVITDPPFNVPIQGHVSGRGQVQHEEFLMASGEMTQAQFTAFLRTSFEAMKLFSLDGSLHYIYMDWRHVEELQAAASGVYNELKNLAVWVKHNAGMGAFYRSQHELVFIYKHGTAPHINNIALGKYGRYRSNVWNYRGANSPQANGRKDLELHPTVKPSRMLADALLDSTNPGALVLDPFGGSGSTLIAAETTGRRARLIEIDPRYVDVTIQRWQELSGKQAMHEATNSTYIQLKEVHGDE